jgi:hypothetical protein
MRPSAAPWPSRVPDRALFVAAALGAVAFLVLAAGNPVPLDRLLRLQLAFTAERWNAVLSGGVANEAVRSHLVRDVAGMMPAYTVALTAFFSLRWRRAVAGASRASADALLASAWLAVGVFAFDLVENAAMWAAAGEGAPGDALVLAVSFAATLKWGLLAVALLLPVASALRGARGA